MQVGDYDYLAADELLGRVSEGDTGDDRARFGFTDIDFQMEELVGTFDAFGRHNLAYTEIDFREVIDGNKVGVVCWLCRGRCRLRGLADQCCLAVFLGGFEFLHLGDGGLGFEAREHRGDWADFLARPDSAPC